MFTRKDYALDGKCTHQQYYAQFVTEEIKLYKSKLAKMSVIIIFYVTLIGDRYHERNYSSSYASLLRQMVQKV